MSKSIYFSVILPSYNRVEFVSQAIESVQQQTFDNWELFVVNDCSTDTTQEIISKYSCQKIKLINLTKNSGVSHARNYALNLADGKYVTFLDDDDLYASTFLQTLYDQIQSDKEGYDYYWTGIRVLNSKAHNKLNSGVDTIWSVDSKQKDDQELLMKKIALSHGMCIKTQSLKQVGFFDEAFVNSEDKELFLRMIEADFSYKAISSVQIYKRDHDYPKLSHNSDNIVRVESAERIIEKHIDYLSTNKRLLKLLQKSLARKYFRANQHKQGRELMSQLFKDSLDIQVLFKWAKLEMKYSSH